METPELHNDSWGQACFTDVWSDDYRDLSYINEPFNDVITEKIWRDRGFDQQRFTGDLYDMRSPEPSWMTYFRQWLPMQHFGWSLYRMTPGTVLPEHGDTYRRFREIYGVRDLDRIRRYVIFLDNWKSGHYLEVNDVPIVGWSKGSAVFWHGAVPHIAANIGREDRYTLQITGVV